MPSVPFNIETLTPYQPGKSAEEIRELYGLDRVIKLASNENPLGPAPRAIEAVREALATVHLYPRGGLRLRERLAELYEVSVDQVMVGGGSEAILLNLIRAYLTPEDEILTAEGTFIAIYVMSQAQGVKLNTVPLHDYRYDLDAMADEVTDSTKLIYLANPNNPTGTIFTRDEFERFITRIPEHILIVFDEAYFEYTSRNADYPDSMNYRYDNVVTLRTFSKAYGLAGTRIGYGFAQEDICRNVRKVKLPFDPSALAEAAGIGALSDHEFLQRTLDVNSDGRQFLSEHFRDLGLRVIPTEANFFMIEFDTETEAMRVADDLLRLGIIVRPLKAFRLPHCLRVTIGTPVENRILVDSLSKVIQVTV
jgi:histidinol-phosphate aminotransferase